MGSASSTSANDEVFPPPPTDKIDWSKLDLSATNLVNGHVESRYSSATGEWSEPEFVADPHLRIHGLSTALNYGQQAYEGMKAYRTPDSSKILIFRPDKNASRMAHSASYVSMPCPSPTQFLSCVQLAVSANASFVPPSSTNAALYLRPLLFGIGDHLPLTPATDYLFCVYVLPFGVYHGANPIDGVIMEDFDRAAPKGTGSAKIGGNYAPVIRWSDKARKEGFGITLHLDSKRGEAVEEFSTSGFVGVIGDGGKGTRLVVPDSGNVIESITSECCLELGRGFGWEIERRVIKYSELGTFNEVLACGTAASVVPIRSITCKSKSDKFTYLDGNEPGPCCTKLLAELKGIQRGERPDKYGWCELAKEVKDFKRRD